MRYSLTVQEEHDERLRALIFPNSGNEGAAVLLCGRAEIERDPWDGGRHRKFVSYDVMPIAAEDILSTSAVHVATKTGTLVRALKRAAEEELTVAIVHSHPRGVANFSAQDDSDEPYLVELARNRNGQEAVLLSIVMTVDEIAGRVWHDMERRTPLDMIRVVGRRVSLSFAGRLAETTKEAFNRQALAFGGALNADLAALRIGIAGAGATGSATAVLVARLGARRIVAVDDDVVEKSNLSRLHGATMEDARNATQKVEVLKRHVEDFGLGANVVAIRGWIGDPACRDVLKSCDVIFGCTDDNDGRLLLNRLAYFYLIPVIDMGIGIDPSEDDPPRIIDAAGRVTVLSPRGRCLLCRNVVDPDMAREEQLERAAPEEHERQKREGYVRGGGPNPAVITFTTDVACMAVDELIHRLTGYRSAGERAHRVRKYHLMEDKKPGAARDECRICVARDYWGRGDMQPFLDRTG